MYGNRRLGRVGGDNGGMGTVKHVTRLHLLFKGYIMDDTTTFLSKLILSLWSLG